MHGNAENTETGCEKIIRAFTIFNKYTDTQWPTHCEHDIMYVCVEPDKVSAEDRAELEGLGFEPDGDNPESFSSYRFGSA